MSRKILFARHGESTYNAENLINADPGIESALTRAGQEQARRLAELLVDEPIELIFTSRLLRARETAEIVNAQRGIRSIELSDLDEPLAGDLEGRPVIEYITRLRKLGPEEPNPGGGESQFQALRRYLNAFRQIASRPEEHVLVIAHGVPIRWLVKSVGGADPAALDRVARWIPDADRPGDDLQNVEIGFATPFFFEADDIRRGIRALESYLSTNDRKHGSAYQ